MTTATVLSTPELEPPPRSDGRTEFRATRCFVRSVGVEVPKGEILVLDDKEAANLVALDAVEPVHARDRIRLKPPAVGKIEWALPR